VYFSYQSPVIDNTYQYIVLMFQGVYVLQDNRFRFLTQMSSGKQYMEIAPKVCLSSYFTPESDLLNGHYIFITT